MALSKLIVLVLAELFSVAAPAQVQGIIPPSHNKFQCRIDVVIAALIRCDAASNIDSAELRKNLCRAKRG